MPYCTAADVRTMVDTALTEGEIADIIETSDAEIDRRIGVQSGFDKVIKKLSMLLTAYAIKGRQPRSQVIGEYREDSGDLLEAWKSEIEGIYRLYKGISAKASEYRHIDEDVRFQ